MRVLILGCSSIVRRRVLPAFRSLDQDLELHLATRRPDELRGAAAAGGLSGIHGDYAAAIATCGADLVYVSLPNALHAAHVRAALEHGCHVIVDKPALLDAQTADACLALAERRGLLLAEATVWDCHPVWERVAQLQAETGCNWRHVAATFVFPHPAAGDFRRSAALGGGACNDLGPYTAACARRFVGSVDRLSAATLERDPAAGRAGVDLAFGLLATRAGCALTGQFGFGAEYANRIELFGDTAHFAVEPAFTTPADAPVAIHWRHRDVEHRTVVPAADSFARFLARAVGDARAGRARQAVWAERLRADAHFLERLRTACGATR